MIQNKLYYPNEPIKLKEKNKLNDPNKRNALNETEKLGNYKSDC